MSNFGFIVANYQFYCSESFPKFDMIDVCACIYAPLFRMCPPQKHTRLVSPFTFNIKNDGIKSDTIVAEGICLFTVG